ncbi:unnamed protein product [Linum tenue]|uniref:Uncharacterized protein n=1 Tax=Linum tenue TaxID=586396 RepID=A0AAV0LP15_9ROSI|nr:unnamed protein product [Linum tenue]
MGGVKKDGNAKAEVKTKKSGFSGKLVKSQKSSGGGGGGKEVKDSYAIVEGGTRKTQPERHYSGEFLLSVSRELKPSKPPVGGDTPTKVTHKTSFLGRAGTMGLEKTLEVLDTLGSSISNLNGRSGFVTGIASRGNIISILTFEVANTISKGVNLFQSLSEENVEFLKKEILHSQGVKRLISTDMKELPVIAVADKRLDSEASIDKQSRQEAERSVQELTNLVQHTSIMEKLVDIVIYLHQAILEAFGTTGVTLVDGVGNHQRLGKAGLALHYAHLITQIDNNASRPTSLPPNTRDSLYQGLPPTVKISLRSRIQMFEEKEELSIAQVKAEMEKTLQWLVLVAANTTKAHQGFGWVGEWANTGSDYGRADAATRGNLICLQALYHADKETTDQHILETVAWLHRLITLVGQRDNDLRSSGGQAGHVPKSATFRGQDLHSKMQRIASLNEARNYHHGSHIPRISAENRDLLDKVGRRRRLIPGISKSQELSKKSSGRVWAALSRTKSTGNSPLREMGRRRKFVQHQRGNLLDILDGLDSM